jgi:hypothetical protein
LQGIETMGVFSSQALRLLPKINKGAFQAHEFILFLQIIFETILVGMRKVRIIPGADTVVCMIAG